MAPRVDPPIAPQRPDIPQGQSTYIPDEIIRIGNALYVYRNGRLVDITADMNYNIPQGQSTYLPDNVIRIGNSLYSYENGILKDITTDRNYNIPQGERNTFDIERAGSGTYTTMNGKTLPDSWKLDQTYNIPQGQRSQIDKTISGNTAYIYENGVLKDVNVINPPPQSQPWRELGEVPPPGPAATPPAGVKPVGETVVTRGDQNYHYVDGVLRGVTPVSGNSDYQKQQNADAAYYSNVVAYNQQQQAAQQQAAAVAAARERALAPYRDLATQLLEQLGSGEYASAEADLRGKLNKMTKRARKDINTGYSGLLEMLRGQANPYGNLSATQVEQPAQLQALLAQQGVGSNILEQEIAAQQMANAGGAGAFADLANQLSAAWQANQQGLGNEARLQRRYARDILAGTKQSFGADLAAREDAKRANIENQLSQIADMGIDLPGNWNTLADRGKGLRKLKKLPTNVQDYLRGLAGAK